MNATKTVPTHARVNRAAQRDVLAVILAAEARYVLAGRVLQVRLARPGISAASVALALGCEQREVEGVWPKGVIP